MSIPRPNYNPPFNITRASHIVLTVRDLEASLAFYSELIGLVVSERTGDTLYLRGLEEACHHSLVLQRTGAAPVCRRIGLRVFTDDDLDKAESHFRKAGLPAQWVEVAHQGRTLHVTDPQGTPFELCATMTVMPRMVTEFATFKGGSAHRLDHFQVLVPDVDQACAFHMGLGYRCSEYIVADPQEALSGVFLQRKGNPHDLVLLNGSGPRLHHVAYTSIDAFTLMRACDVAAISATASRSSADRAGTGRATPSSCISAIRTATASNCSRPTIRSWTSRTSPCAGIQRANCARNPISFTQSKTLRSRNKPRAKTKGNPF